MFKLKIKFDSKINTDDFVSKFKLTNIKGTSIETVSDEFVIVDSDTRKTHFLVKKFVTDSWKPVEQKNKISLEKVNKETTKSNAKS
jgi:hypothetical protein